ncbi:MAG: outer rane efflux protein [Myxococcaceae bacterium]|nr:outer rane efflux protein [Myxococcaceae bacterium]
MRSIGVLGAAILAAWSFATPAQAQAPAGATGAAPGTAPNAPPPPAVPAAGTAPTGTPDIARAPAGNDQPSGSPGAITAETVGQRSVTTSYQAKAAEQNLTAAGARADQQWTNYLPRIGLTARYTRLSSFTAPSLSGSGGFVGTTDPPGTANPPNTFALPPFAFPLVLDNYLTQATIAIPISDYLLRIGKAYSASTMSEDAARFDVVAARAKSYADGKVAYFTWLRARGAVGVSEQSLAVARAHQKDSENQFAVGNASKADVLRAQTQVAAAELALERAKSGVALTERQVRIAIHGKDDEALTPGDSLDGPVPAQQASLRTLVAEAELQRPEIKSIDKSAESARKLADVQRAGKYPVLSGFGDVTYANPNQRVFPQTSTWFPTWSVGAQITWSPNDVISAGAAGADAEARAAALDAQKQATRDGVELEVTQAYQAIVEADAAITSTQRQLESSVEGYRVARELFNNGRGTATTLIDAEIVLAQTRFEHLNARVDARIARIRLDHALGRDAKMQAP